LEIVNRLSCGSPPPMSVGTLKATRLKAGVAAGKPEKSPKGVLGTPSKPRVWPTLMVVMTFVGGGGNAAKKAGVVLVGTAAPIAVIRAGFGTNATRSARLRTIMPSVLLKKKSLS